MVCHIRREGKYNRIILKFEYLLTIGFIRNPNIINILYLSQRVRNEKTKFYWDKNTKKPKITLRFLFPCYFFLFFNRSLNSFSNFSIFGWMTIWQ